MTKDRKEKISEAVYNRGLTHGIAGIPVHLPRNPNLHDEYREAHEQGVHDAHSFGYSKKDRAKIRAQYKDTAALRTGTKEHELPYWDKK